MMEMLENYSAKSKQVIKAYQAAMEQAAKREKTYGTNQDEARDIAKQNLLDAKQQIREEYKAELAKATMEAKKKVVAGSRVSQAEIGQIAGFVETLELAMLTDGAKRVVYMLDGYRDSLTDVQASYVYAQLAPKLAAEGLDKFDLKRLAQSYSNKSQNELTAHVEELEKNQLENPTMEVDMFLLADESGQKSKAMGAPRQNMATSDKGFKVEPLDSDGQ